MPLPAPNLDDRTFDQLVADALAMIRAKGGAWRDPSVGDPGTVLVDVFAFLTEQLLFRLNRVPERAYIEFLNLIGAALFPPSAAVATLTFSVQAAAQSAIVIPRGTRVSAARSAASSTEVVFATVDDATLAAGATTVDVRAINAERIDDELVGMGTGEGGQSFTVARSPIVGKSGTSFDLLVAVEMNATGTVDRARARVVDGVAYELWQEVENFADAEPEMPAFVCDRTAGTITFAPRLREDADGTLPDEPVFIARVPEAGRRIRVGYATGGGPAGNVVADALATIKDQINAATLRVTNAEPATGGRSAETIDNALLRGPRNFHQSQRAVTARDFEAIAADHPAVARARAYPKHELWNYATPGTVAVLLVPQYLEPEQRGDGAVTAQGLQSVQTADTRTSIAEAIDARRPLGVVCAVDWVRYKTVKVRADVVTTHGEDAAAVAVRLVHRLHALINPLPTTDARGWPFKRALYASDVTNVLLAERGVAYYTKIELIVDDAPATGVRALCADPTAAERWYATSDSGLFRSLDDAASWERVAAFADERIIKVALTAEGPGLLAVVSQTPADGDPKASIVRISGNAGESWGPPAQFDGLAVADLAWAKRDDGFYVLLATDKGLYELANAPGATPLQVPVFDGDTTFGFFSIATTRVSGSVVVALAAQGSKGTWVSNAAGLGRTFEAWWAPPNPDSISVLRVQRDGARAFLWAGFGASGDDPGKGAARIELSGAPKAQSAQNWDAFDGWAGQGVRELAFSQSTVYAASLGRGVVRLNFRAPSPTWQPMTLQRGLKERSQSGAAAVPQYYELVTSVAASDGVVLAGGASGVYKSTDAGEHYEFASATSFDDVVPLPPMWLFCSGVHDVRVTEEPAR